MDCNVTSTVCSWLPLSTPKSLRCSIRENVFWSVNRRVHLCECCLFLWWCGDAIKILEANGDVFSNPDLILMVPTGAQQVGREAAKNHCISKSIILESSWKYSQEVTQRQATISSSLSLVLVSIITYSVIHSYLVYLVNTDSGNIYIVETKWCKEVDKKIRKPMHGFTARSSKQMCISSAKNHTKPEYL